MWQLRRAKYNATVELSSPYLEIDLPLETVDPPTPVKSSKEASSWEAHQRR